MFEKMSSRQKIRGRSGVEFMAVFAHDVLHAVIQTHRDHRCHQQRRLKFKKQTKLEQIVHPIFYLHLQIVLKIFWYRSIFESQEPGTLTHYTERFRPRIKHDEPVVLLQFQFFLFSCFFLCFDPQWGLKLIIP